MSRYRRDADFPAVRRYARAEFLERVWVHRPGEHVTFLAPTQNGKTTLALDLLARTAVEEHPGLVLMMKPRDKVTAKWLEGVAFRKVTSWPQPPSLWHPRKPPGWVVWPPHTFDPDVDDPKHYATFRSTLLDSYKRGNRIVFADETRSLERELGLSRELVTIWTKGASMGCSMWAASQVPKFMSTEAYSQASHVFIGYTPEQRDQERFGEISGVNPYLVRHTVENLQQYEWLYIRQRDRVMCIINAN